MMAIRADVTLENADDQALVRHGHATEGNIRRTTVSGLVGTSAAMLRLPAPDPTPGGCTPTTSRASPVCSSLPARARTTC